MNVTASLTPQTVIFLDIDGVLNVSARDEMGALLISEENIQKARTVLRNGSGPPDVNSARKIIALSKRREGRQGSGDTLGTRTVNEYGFCEEYVDRFVAILEATSPTPQVVLSSSWRRIDKWGAEALRAAIEQRLGRDFDWAGVTSARKDNTPQDRLKCIGDYIAAMGVDACGEVGVTNSLSISSILSREARSVTPSRSATPSRRSSSSSTRASSKQSQESADSLTGSMMTGSMTGSMTSEFSRVEPMEGPAVRFLVIDDFFMRPFDGWRCGSARIEGAREAETYLAGRWNHTSQCGVEVKVVQPYEEFLTDEMATVHAAVGLTPRYLKACLDFVARGGGARRKSSKNPVAKMAKASLEALARARGRGRSIVRDGVASAKSMI